MHVHLAHQTSFTSRISLVIHEGYIHTTSIELSFSQATSSVRPFPMSSGSADYKSRDFVDCAVTLIRVVSHTMGVKDGDPQISDIH